MKALISILIILGCIPAFAQDSSDETGSEAALTASLAAERAKKRNYPGGRDEQDLTVQAVLPQPARAPEAQSQVSVGEDSAHD